MRRLSIPFLLPWLAFIIPINIYMYGITAGIQWAVIRIQLNSYGLSLISLGNDVYYITKGLLGIRTLASTYLWFAGAGLLLIGIIFLLRDFHRQTPNPYRIPGMIMMLSGVLFLAADIAQYGFFFTSNQNLCVPLGTPFLFVAGYWECRYALNAGNSSQEALITEVFGAGSPVGTKLSEFSRSPVLQELAVLILISVFAKLIVFSLSVFSPYMMNQADAKIYFNYANATMSGGLIPYHDFPVEYPQLFFVPVFISMIPGILVPGYGTFYTSFLILNCLIDTATLVFVYFIARRVVGEERAFLCGVLYATAFSAIFFVSMTYDIFPAFLFMGSLLLFIRGKEAGAYLAAAAGALAKWFPAVCFPYYLLYSLKNREDLRPALAGIGLSALLGGFVLIPLLFLNTGQVLETYTIHLGRLADPHGMIYYLDVICSTLFHARVFSDLSMPLIILGEIALIVWYYRSLDGRLITLCTTLFLAIFVFFLLNKIGTPTFIIWFTPLLAILFVNSTTEIVGFYLVQLAVYAENPLLLGTVWGPGMVYNIMDTSHVSYVFLFYTLKFSIMIAVLIYVVWNLYRSTIPEPVSIPDAGT